MQGHKRAIGSLPEGLSFDHGSSSSGAGIDDQICWNNPLNSSQNRLSGFNISPSNTADMYLNSTIEEGQNLSGWNIGEPSSSASPIQPSHGERTTEHGWSSSMKAFVGAGPNFDVPQYEPTSTVSLDAVSVNLSRSQIANGPLFMQSSSSDALPQDLNVNSTFASHGVVEHRVVEHPNAFRLASENLRLGTDGSSSDPFGAASGGSGGYLEEETDIGPGFSLEGRRLSCKRKAIEANIGQSSEGGSSNFFQRGDSVWQAISSRRNVSSSLNISAPAVSSAGDIPSEQIIPRLGLGVGSSSDNPLVLGSPGPGDSSRRNIRLRINASHQQDSGLTNNVHAGGRSVGSSNLAVPYSPARLLALNNPVDLRSPASAAADNSSPQTQSVLRVPALRRNLQSSRWNRSSSSRASRSSSFVVSGERDAESNEAQPNSRSMPRNISEHPIFLPATEMRNSAQDGFTWSSTGGRNVIAAGNVASTSRAGSSSGVHPSSAPNWAPHRSSPHYPRRLSEFVRRSLLASADFEAGGQTNSVTPPASGSSASSPEVPIPSGVSNQGHHHLSHSRSALLLDRQLDGAFGVPYSLRNLAAAGDGRSRLVSELRNVLDLMRRGEGLRFEDVMILDQSVFYGMTDVHDRHRDMRLDVDNMSYEELLALEERIGNVNTGLTEETISNRLKHKKYTSSKTGQQDAEPCSICREEYSNGEDLGALECGHDFHTDCIKQWLMQKNLCPICKATGLPT